MPITIDGNGTITGAATLATTVANPTFTTPNINSAQFATVSGTAPIYPCRAWVNFAGDGTVAIRASGNVTSISDNGVGDYTMNFTTALSDADYAVVGIVGNASAATFGILTGPRTSAATTSAFRFLTTTAGPTNTDYPVVQLAVFR